MSCSKYFHSRCWQVNLVSQFVPVRSGLMRVLLKERKKKKNWMLFSGFPTEGEMVTGEVEQGLLHA